MRYKNLFAAAVVATLASPLTAQAQGIPDGMAHGAYVGYHAAGPLGWAVGGAVGGVIGGIEGLFGIGPSYAGYWEGPPRAYHHRHKMRHSAQQRRSTSG